MMHRLHSLFQRLATDRSLRCDDAILENDNAIFTVVIQFTTSSWIYQNITNGLILLGFHYSEHLRFLLGTTFYKLGVHCDKMCPDHFVVEY